MDALSRPGDIELEPLPDPAPGAAGFAPHSVHLPAGDLPPLVFASPHAGRQVPQDMQACAAPMRLRRLEDALVDRLIAHAPALGAPLVVSHVARSYIDLNRDPLELDPGMFSDPLPDSARGGTARVAAGLGVIPRLADGVEIYRRKLTFAEAQRRVQAVHAPYHQAIRDLLDQALARHGGVLLVDWHSMPASAAAQGAERGRRAPDVVLGDRRGLACRPGLIDLAHRLLTEMGLGVGRNNPYAGGYTTQHYGRPETGVQALQIEINRGLYLNEQTLAPSEGFDRLQRALDQFTLRLVAAAPGLIT